MTSSHYNVAPRYTPGSPAMVDEATAVRVAAEEKESIEYVLQGYEGEESRLRAVRLGLRGVAEHVTERGSGKRLGWLVVDLCTGERFFRLCYTARRSLGWRAYTDLAGYERDLVVRQPPTDIEDYKKADYRFEPVMHAGLPTGWKIAVYRPERIG